MARYIDADALETAILTKYRANWEIPCSSEDRLIQRVVTDLRVLIEQSVTADVVPKSEVAREIKKFEQQVGKIYNHYVFEDTDYADDDVAREAVINALTDVLNDLAELKKKYTEERE